MYMYMYMYKYTSTCTMYCTVLYVYSTTCTILYVYSNYSATINVLHVHVITDVSLFSDYQNIDHKRESYSEP